jgi:hypothetical protein
MIAFTGMAAGHQARRRSRARTGGSGHDRPFTNPLDRPFTKLPFTRLMA